MIFFLSLYKLKTSLACGTTFCVCKVKSLLLLLLDKLLRKVCGHFNAPNLGTHQQRAGKMVYMEVPEI